LIRLAGKILMDINDEWITGIRYLSMNEFMGPRRFERRSQDPQSCRIPGYPMAPHSEL
jgi:hypothetical protein